MPKALRRDMRPLSVSTLFFAKGKLAFDMKASEPIVNNEGKINLKREPVIL